MKSAEEVDAAVEVAENFKPLADREEGELLEVARELVHQDSQQGEQGPLFWLRDTNTLAWTYGDEPALVSY